MAGILLAEFMQIIRLTKIALVFSVALLLFLIVLNNITDYGSNLLFVENVLGMTTVFEGNQLMWRSIDSPLVHTIFYATIILWEGAAMVFCFIGGYKLLSRLKAPQAVFAEGKSLAIAGLVLSMLQWFVAFITIGGEWFTMWQSEIWNGQDAAFRMFACFGIILIFVYLPEFGENSRGLSEEENTN